LRLQVTENTTDAEGRVLAHTPEYLLLEGTDGRVHYITGIGGKLQPNSFVRLIRGQATDLGNADSYLQSPYLRERAKRLLADGVFPGEPTWGGWLGRYQRALQRETQHLRKERAVGR
jgi:hypothetical protein